MVALVSTTVRVKLGVQDCYQIWLFCGLGTGYLYVGMSRAFLAKPLISLVKILSSSPVKPHAFWISKIRFYEWGYGPGLKFCVSKTVFNGNFEGSRFHPSSLKTTILTVCGLIEVPPSSDRKRVQGQHIDVQACLYRSGIPHAKKVWWVNFYFALLHLQLLV